MTRHFGNIALTIILRSPEKPRKLLLGIQTPEIMVGIILIDIGMQCVQLSNQSATLKLCGEASSRMNTIFMVTYFIGGSLGTFLAGTLWTLLGWNGTVLSGALLVTTAILFSLATGRRR